MSQATLGSGPYQNSNLFSGYYLDERVADLDAWDCDAEAKEAFEQIRDLWEKEGTLLPSYNEDDLIGTWIAEVVDILGYGTSSEVTLPDGGGYVDRLLFENDDVRREGAKRALDGDHEGLFSRASAILEAKQWDSDFEQRFAEQRSYRDASHQIKYYLERTPSDLKWGVLTDGKKWRLYGTKDYETQTYYEVDLPEILESGDLEAFKYFYVFFRPEAFVETAGSSFLDNVWTESETAAQELGEDLQDNVFRALRVLGKGFVESNDLDIDPDDEDARDELKKQSLVLLYRLMFVLYAESRGLIDPDDPAASDEYQEYFSLEAKREEIIDDMEGLDVESGDAFDDEFSQYSSSIWGRLSELFELIDEGEEDLDIPPYNGGLFSHEDHAFLTEHEVKDPYIAEVIFWLSTTENDEGEHVPADYADLDTRHLGSIYEGLLEHEFRIAGPEGVAAVAEDGGQVWKPGDEVSVADAVEVVDEGGLYVVNDEGERKATGAYYTPDYVVTYIVEETVDPLIDEIDSKLREEGLEPSDRKYFVEFWQEVKGLTILDPAMGSGHFLTKATGYLTEQVMSVVREQEIQSYDEQDIRRDISKEVIYGVDLNGMAVELSKLSMWLETLAADQPLAFLDHHLKTGNSLVGSDITEVLSDDTEENGGQLTLTQAFARVRQDTLEHVMELMSDLLAFDNDSLESVKSMEELYEEIREDPLYQRLFQLANVHTAEEFGCDVPEDAYEQMAGAIEDGDDWAEIEKTDWFKPAQATAEEQDFFHWELEFPEVFFNRDGKKKAELGFDTVVGNPPWMGTRTGSMPDDLVSYMREEYVSAVGQFDLAAVLLERGIKLSGGSDPLCFVVPKRIATNESYEDLRKRLATDRKLSQAIDLGVAFEGVNNDALILLSRNDSTDTPTLMGERQNKNQIETWEVSDSLLPAMPFTIFPVNSSQSQIDLVDKINRSSTTRLGPHVSINRGAECGMNHASISDQASESTRPIVDHRDVNRHYVKHSGQHIDLNAIDEDTLKGREIYEEAPKLLVRFLASELIIGKDTHGYYSTNMVYHMQCGENLDYLCGLLPARLLSFWYLHAFQNDEIKFPHLQQSHLESLPIILDSESVDLSSFSEEDYPPQVSEHLSEAGSSYELIESVVDPLIEYKNKRSGFNLNFQQYLGNTSYDVEISSVGLLQPTAQTDSILNKTTEDYPNLKTGSVSVERESSNTVLIKATARYKPENEDAHETDQWGYTETDPLPAFRITDLTEPEADLIEHFVPVAVDEAGGFANFREAATKTNSLVDRLKVIELPDVDDVADDLENYLRAVERAEELDEKIEKTDDLIDEIVYELYGLTDEEIEIVEEAVN
ncbi:restriction endonuclease [Halorubrum sp. GN11_10-6_MGM]|uniref:Eco57I restriction-modification methylase domain-containing protein n=1 Tax=Halorubrum sp. GN11_10-6_MGM TaxID=2518112 RepID=UPI0010F7C58F|nr:TaqI-like C-terminal specificity domain-containing protein [Halorubrum sp. GN11_10-6_MGM]TKX73912.1 restriction endonuclease [Halorubrum sp. GN11_10-6_MGM]